MLLCPDNDFKKVKFAEFAKNKNNKVLVVRCQKSKHGDRCIEDDDSDKKAQELLQDLLVKMRYQQSQLNW